MLSLLNLIIASGTVLRSDTELWTAESYPDPRTNSTQCNVPAESGLCDPDHILTDQWRETIHLNIQRQMQRLRESPILYTEGAPEECFSNETQSVEIFVILAKRIQTASNQTINETDMTTFGHGIVDAFGLANLTCKNFLLLVGVEQAKQAYVRTGRDLRLPSDLMENVGQYTNLFNEKNYMEGLNKVIDEIGDQMITYFNPTTTTEAAPITEEGETSTEENTETPPAELRKIGDKIEIRIPIWVFVVVSLILLILLIACATASFLMHHSGISRVGTQLQRLVSGTDNRAFSGDERPVHKFPESRPCSMSSFIPFSPYEVPITRSQRSNDKDESRQDRTGRHSGASHSSQDDESCEITLPDSDDDRPENAERPETTMPKLHLSSSELSTDEILTPSPKVTEAEYLRATIV